MLCGADPAEHGEAVPAGSWQRLTGPSGQGTEGGGIPGEPATGSWRG